MCETQVGIREPRNSCPLCLKVVCASNAKTLSEGSEEWDLREHTIRLHIADHLEQLALFVALPTGNLGSEPDTDLNFLDDSDSEADQKNEIESIASAEISRNFSRVDVRNANIARYFGEQNAIADTPSIAGTRLASRPALSPKTSGAATPEHAEFLTPEHQEINFPVSTVLQPRNEFFYGKSQILDEIDDFLRLPGNIYVLCGFGGVGKTLTAVEYSYRAKSQYDGVFWIQADTHPGLAGSWIQMTNALGISHGTDDEKRAIERGREWLGLTGKQTDLRGVHDKTNLSRSSLAYDI
jgi:hypothetical protein